MFCFFPSCYYYEDYGYGSSITDHMKPHNYSITSLNMGLNDIRENGVEQLVNLIKNNAVLRTLVLDLSPHITPKNYREIATAIRLYNSVLEEISLSENALSVKSVEFISRIFDSSETSIYKLTMTNCSMKHQHMTAFAKYVLDARHLTVLDLSGNPIGDKGAAALEEMLQGMAPKACQVVNTDGGSTGSVLPPLKYLDLSSCSFTPGGMAVVLSALSKRFGLMRVDVSNNSIGPDNEDAYSALAQCSVPDLRMASCQLGSKGATQIFQALANKSTPLAQSARYVYLSGNEISDSSSEALGMLLEKNINLEALDLGFNLFTDRDGAYLRSACSVASTSSVEKKVTDLSVNLIGNKCDPYMLETPGLARAKSNFLFGTQPNTADPANHGYTHIPHCSRGHFMARKEIDNHYREHLPSHPINTVG